MLDSPQYPLHYRIIINNFQLWFLKKEKPSKSDFQVFKRRFEPFSVQS